MPEVDFRFPFTDPVPVGRGRYAAADVRRVLAPELSPERAARLAAVVAARTFGVVPVLDGLVDPGNVNAVLRSAEGLGFGAAHLVGLGGAAADLAARYAAGREAAPTPDPRGGLRAARGAHKWLAVRAWDDPEAFARAARAAGVRLAVTALAPGAQPLETYDFAAPTALVVGSERDGASPALLDAADAALVLPLDGFVQSYNVSVAAALALAHARADRRARTGRAGDLAPAEQDVLLAHFLARAVPHAEAFLRRDAESRDADARGGAIR